MLLFSIIIPTYNRAAFIGKAIESIMAQTYSHWELIIIDDASSDETQDVLKRYTDSRIHLYRNEVNKERSASRNKGIELAKGEYICFLDSDDFYYSHHLETLHQKIQSLSQPVALLHTSAAVVDTNGAVMRELKYFYNDFNEKVESVLDHHIQPNAVSVHRDILQRFAFDPELSVNEDVYLFAQIVAVHPVVHIATATVAWVQHTGNTMHLMNDHLLSQVKATQKIFSDPLLVPFISDAFKRKKFFDLYSQLVYFYASNRKHKLSIMYFIKGFRVHPWHKQNRNNVLNVVYHLPGGKWLKKMAQLLN